MMLVLGIDPGPTHCAWALLELGAPGLAPVLGCGLVATEGLDPCLLVPAPAEVVLCLERPVYRPIGGRGDPAQSLAMAAALVSTAWVAGVLVGRAMGHYAAIVTPTCGEVRKALMGRPSCTDGEIKWALAHFVALPKRSNTHTRDSMAVAVAGYQRWRAGATTADQTELAQCAEWAKVIGP